MTPATIQQAAKHIKNASHIAVSTGAGVSAESGVPTFRDAQTGLWAKYDPQQLATADAFRRDPKLVWDWYEFRRGLVRNAKPNPGHFALTELQKRHPKTEIVTQNVDDLHEQAGSTGIIHLHGNIAQSKCFNNCQGDPTVIDISGLTWDAEVGPPACPHCGAHVRPNVVWFGEMLPVAMLDAAKIAAINCDVMLVVGTSGMVNPAASLPIIVKQRGGIVIEVNPNETPITQIADLRLDGPSGEILPQVLAALDNS